MAIHTATMTINVLTLDHAAIKRRLQGRFGGNAAAAARMWPGVNSAPNRSTLSRWLRGLTHPRTKDDLLGFAGALDLDPFALWKIKVSGFPRLYVRIISAIWSDTWMALSPALGFLTEMVKPAEVWPSG